MDWHRRWLVALLFYLRGPSALLQAAPHPETGALGQTPAQVPSLGSPAAWRFIRLMQVGYAAVLVVVFATMGTGVTPDLVLLLLVLGFTLPGQRLRFLRDFTPFVLLLVSYDALRGYADEWGGSVHVHELIAWERALFGDPIPTQALQAAFMDPGTLHWYDYFAMGMYAQHFVLPLLGGALLWQYRRDEYVRFVVGITLLTYSGFITFLLYPAAPPWMASQLGLIPGIRTLDVAWFTALYVYLSPNLVAAMPSLHAAFPVFLLLFAVRTLGMRGLIAVVYPTGVWVSIVYLGQHYVVDLLAGAIYALAAYLFAVSGFVWRLIIRADWTLSQCLRKFRPVRHRPTFPLADRARVGAEASDL